MQNSHIENSLDKIRIIFQRTSERIDNLKVGEKLPATNLAKEIAKEINISGPTLYPTLLFLLRGYPGIELRRGSKGGIVKL
jgi:hypothetical protein